MSLDRGADQPDSRSNEKFYIFADQAASSSTNFGASALAAGLLTASNFGAFSVVFAIYVVVLTGCHAWGADALMVIAPSKVDSERRALIEGAGTTTFVIGCLVGIALVATSPLFEGQTRLAVLCLAPCLPGLMLQESMRFGLIIQNQARRAFVNDAAWMVLSFSILILLRRTDTDSMPLAVLAWGLGATPAAVWGLSQAGSALSIPQASDWVRLTRPISMPMSLEFVLATASGFVMVLLLASLSDDLSEAGALRGAQVLMGPVAVVLAASAMYLRPAMVRSHAKHESVLPIALRQSAVNLAVTLGWIGILAIIPRSVGTKVFGFTWDSARSLYVLVGLAFAAVAIASGPTAALRSQGRLRTALYVRALSAVSVLAGTVLGAVSPTPHGPLKGFVMGTAVIPLIAWVGFLRLDSPSSKPTVDCKNSSMRVEGNPTTTTTHEVTILTDQ